MPTGVSSDSPSVLMRIIAMLITTATLVGGTIEQ
jgi:hypothetical protein